MANFSRVLEGFVGMENQQSRVDMFERFSWKVEKFAQMTSIEKIYSEPFILCGYPWYLNERIPTCQNLLNKQILCSLTSFTLIGSVLVLILVLVLGGFLFTLMGTGIRTACQFIWILCNLLMLIREGPEMSHLGLLFLVSLIATQQSQNV